MGKRLHEPCPNCRCWAPEDGEVMTVWVNGTPLRPGQRRELQSGDVVVHTFDKAPTSDDDA